jgi:hypothetical protein
MGRWLVIALSALVGCQEYNLQGDPSLYAEPNPPDLGTPVQQDRIVQVTVPSVDVLFVMDNSCSMSEEQAALTANFSLFMGYFEGSGLDYHVGVISTDMYTTGDPKEGHKGKLRTIGGEKWISETTTNSNSVFAQMASMGTGGSSDEKGRAAVWTALVTQVEAYNKGFLRDDASLSIIVISDENDYSGNMPVTQDEFIAWLQTMKSEPGMVTFSSIVGPDPSGCATAEAGAQYLRVTREVGGIEWSICDSDWSTVLELLGMQAAGLKREFYLSQVPVEESIAVWVEEDGDEVHFDAGTDWTYDRARNSIRFSEYVPTPLAKVFIEYEVLAAYTEDGAPADTDE